MRFALSDEQTALRDGVRDLLSAASPPAVVRAAWGETGDADETLGVHQRSDAGAEARAALWARCVELGLAGVAVPAEHGGLGLSACDVVPLLEETGRAAVPLPIVETAFVAGPALVAAGEDALLTRLNAGELLIACALDGGVVVPFAAIADCVILSDGAAAGRPLRIVEGPGGVRPAVSIDAARAAGFVDPHAAARELSLSEAERISAWQRGALGSAAQLIGLARALLDLTVAYVKDRRQFGVPIGSFQAIKHHLADALLAIEFAAPAVYRAGWSYDTGAPNTDRDVAMAKALASDAAEQVAATALQCHGAIGYTTEYDLHLFAKRIWASSRSWGGADWQRERVASTLGLTKHAAEHQGSQP